MKGFGKHSTPKRSIVLSSNDILLSVRNLSVGFHSESDIVTIIDGVSFDICKGEIFGLVGESGCGKTVTALALLRLLPKPTTRILSGSISLAGMDILALPLQKLYDVRGRTISMIFQEPSAALNPLLSVRTQLDEYFEYHEYAGNPQQRIDELLNRVGFPDPDRILRAYPHELSGGMLQRVMIAMALLLKPALIIADEPTTALDVTVQAQIMELLIEMQQELGTSILFITHNLNLIAQYADRLAVMYAGRIVEQSNLESFLFQPQHPYSRGLLAALPDLHAENPTLTPIPGQVPQPSEYAAGCRFRERCPHTFDKCVHKPALFETAPHRRVACFLYDPEEK
ncbi:MAG: ATP-binding cassette domain-containing protein [Chitinivibrionales bacterium]|nr:ATP-binding cassette domain-containing protein [Chitinivibrionales bacterium]